MTSDRLLLAQLDVSIRGLERSMTRAGIAIDKTSGRMEKRWNKMSSNLEKRSNAMARGITTAIAAIGLTAAGREVTEYADTWVDYGNKLAAASQVSGFAAASLAELQAGARDARSELDGYVDLYARILRASDGVAESTEEVARVTNLAAKAFAAGGATASEQAAGVLQLGQALGSGFLQGDELRSLRENAPLIAKAIADAFGVTIGELKKLGAEGELTSDKVFKGILEAAPDIEAAFGATIPRATEEARRAMDDLSVAVGEYLVKSGTLEAASNTFANTLQFVSTNVDAFANALVIAAAAISGMLGASGLLAVSAAMGKVAVGATTAAKAMAVLRAASAFLLGPGGFVIAMGAAAAAVATLIIKGDELAEVFESKANKAIRNANELLAETEIYVNKNVVGEIGNQASSAIPSIDKLTEALGDYNDALRDSLSLNFIQQVQQMDTAILELQKQVQKYERQIKLIGPPVTDSDKLLVSELEQEVGKLRASLNGLETRRTRIALEMFGEGRGKAILDAILVGDLAGAVAILEGQLNEVVSEVADGRGGKPKAKKGGSKASTETSDKIKKDQEALKELTKEVERQQRARERAEQQRIGRVDYQLEYQLELARLQGQEELVKVLERELEIRQRMADLKALGAEGDLRGRATQETDALGEAREGSEAREKIAQQKEAFRDVFSSAFQEAIETGNVGNAIKNVFADRVRDGMKQALDNLADVIFDLFKNIDFGGGGSGGGGIISSFVSSLLGGGKAGGGPVSGNRLYRVGEYNRPEIFKSGNKSYLIPGENGMVSPIRGLSQPPSAPTAIDNSVIIQGSITEDVWPRVQAHLAQRERMMASQMATTARAVYAKDKSRGRI